MDVTLIPYHDEKEAAAELITQFWQAQGLFPPSREAADHDATQYTQKGHFLYFIRLDNEIAGFVHLAGGEPGADWLAEIFVLPEFQGKGIDAHAGVLAEDILKAHFESLYSDEDKEDSKPIRQYQKIGYSCRNAAAARKSYRLGKKG